jgi:hypothetical protein
MKRAVLKFEHTYFLHVHPEVFYESVILLVRVTEGIGKLSHIMMNDAAPPRAGVWLRVVFEPPEDGTYPSKLAILDRTNLKSPEKRDVPLQFSLAEDLFEYNGCRISLQNNTRTGHQAFAILLPTTESNGNQRKMTRSTQSENKRGTNETKPIPQTNSSSLESAKQSNGAENSEKREPVGEGVGVISAANEQPS